MKHIFVLDENVFIQSFTCRNIQDSQDDFNSLNLILGILRNCHRVGLSSELTLKYREKSKTLEKKEKIYGNVIRIWNNLLYISNKHRLSNSHLENLPTNLLDDSHVIEPTVFLSGILVTTDDKLKRRLTEWAEKKRLKLTIKSPKEALGFITNS